MIRLVLTNHYNGQPLELYIEGHFSVCESKGTKDECRCISVIGAEYFVKETREKIAAQATPS
jgi:hypothetical protein